MKRFLRSLTRRLRHDVKPPSNRTKYSCQNFDVGGLSLEEELDLIHEFFDETTVINAVFVTDEQEYLVQIFSDGQAHLSVRKESHDSWSPGWWTVANEYDGHV